VATTASGDLRPWLGGDFRATLDGLGIPACISDRRGVVRWQNPRSLEVFGRKVGRPLLETVALESRRAVGDSLAKKLLGAEASSDYDSVLRGRNGQRVPVTIHSVALRDRGRVVGSLAVIETHDALPAGPAPRVTPRQLEILRLLADGCSTDQIAKRLHLSVETVRNHVRSLLRRMRVHSRLAAVAEGRRLGLIG